MAHPDFEEFIASLNERRVRYLVIGAHAVAFHARPRATKDLDLFVDGSVANARRLLAALADFFGGSPPRYTVADITNPDIVLQLGLVPVRIDILTAVDGVPAFAGAWKRRSKGRFGKVDANYLSLVDLIDAKVAADRPQDRADLVSLRRATSARRRR